MTFDEAIELLEITEDVDHLSESDLTRIQRTAQRRWHPDKVPKADEGTRKRYEENFKKIELAMALIRRYKKDGYIPRSEQFDAADMDDWKSSQKEEANRRQAPEWLAYAQTVWAKVKQANWRMTLREEVLSDGFPLRDVLRQDLRDEVAIWSMVSILCGFYLFVAASLVALFLPFLFFAIAPAFLLHVLLCLLLAMPLSRLWLPGWLGDLAYKSQQMLLEVGYFMERVPLLRRLIVWPWYFANGFNLLILRPLYELAGYLLRDKIVGIKKRNTFYFETYDTRYVEVLLSKQPQQMNRLELNDLFSLYNMLLTFKH